MGYLSTFWTEDLEWVDDQRKLKELHDLLQKWQDRHQEPWQEELVFVLEFSEELEELQLNDEIFYKKIFRPVLCYDDYAKFYHDEQWVAFLAQYIKKGRIKFRGEDGALWGYEFEDHKAFALRAVITWERDDDPLRSPIPGDNLKKNEHEHEPMAGGESTKTDDYIPEEDDLGDDEDEETPEHWWW